MVEEATRLGLAMDQKAKGEIGLDIGCSRGRHVDFELGEQNERSQH